MLDFDSLRQQYGYFKYPVTKLKINGKDFADNKKGFIISDVDVELTAGYEASIASFCLYGVFDQDKSTFLIDEIKKFVLLGAPVEIALGYENTALKIFVGFVARVNFFHPEEGQAPGVRVTAMDIKGIMMANNYSKQLKSLNYSDAVREILEKDVYQNMINREIIKSNMIIDDTPDKIAQRNSAGGEKTTDRTMEMVCESDYEFVVRAAKKYNFDFYTLAGTVIFQKAKKGAEVQLEIGPETGLHSFDVEYDITGLVEKIETRGMDIGKAQAITGKAKFSNKISLGNKAKAFIKKTEKVYVDPTITSQTEADNRAQSLLEDISYRFGTLNCVTIGIPELMPGQLVSMKSMGSAVSNTFYVTSIRHTMDQYRGYETHITGKAASIEPVSGGMGGISGGLI